MGLIYMRTSPSGGKYIGKTVKTESARWKSHVYEAYNTTNSDYHTLLNRAIRKYGGENFQSRILEDNVPNEALSTREIYWINYYKTYYLDNNHGYNMTRGGDGVSHYKSEDFLFYWNQGLSIADISDKMNVRKQTVADYLHKSNVDKEEIIKRGILTQRKSSFTFDLEKAYQLWQEGNNLTAIKKYFNLDQSNNAVRDALKDFYNITDDDIKQRGIQTRQKNSGRKPINQFDLNHKLIATWNSVAEASRSLNVTRQAIDMNLKHKTKTCQNYIFEYKENI